jgi:hypothetical protein
MVPVAVTTERTMLRLIPYDQQSGPPARGHLGQLRTETHPDVRDALANWPSVRAVLTARTARA